MKLSQKLAIFRDREVTRQMVTESKFLNINEKILLKRRYFDRERQNEIAEKMNVTPQNIHHIERKALLKLYREKYFRMHRILSQS